jgi:hypothetical protein
MLTPFVALAAAAVMPNLTQLRKMGARLAPVTLKYDESGLSDRDRHALPKLLDAARVMNTIFMDQIWSGNRALYEKLQQDSTALGKVRGRISMGTRPSSPAFRNARRPAASSIRRT